MPSRTSSGTASSTSLNACFAATIRDWPSMSRARIEPLTSSTRSTCGEAAVSCAVGPLSAAAVPAGSSTPVARVATRAQTPAASRFLVIIGGSY
jgi:hypothetical protein